MTVSWNYALLALVLLGCSESRLAADSAADSGTDAGPTDVAASRPGDGGGRDADASPDSLASEAEPPTHEKPR